MIKKRLSLQLYLNQSQQRMALLIRALEIYCLRTRFLSSSQLESILYKWIPKLGLQDWKLEVQFKPTFFWIRFQNLYSADLKYVIIVPHTPYPRSAQVWIHASSLQNKNKISKTSTREL